MNKNIEESILEFGSNKTKNNNTLKLGIRLIASFAVLSIAAPLALPIVSLVAPTPFIGIVALAGITAIGTLLTTRNFKKEKNQYQTEKFLSDKNKYTLRNSLLSSLNKNYKNELKINRAKDLAQVIIDGKVNISTITSVIGFDHFQSKSKLWENLSQNDKETIKNSNFIKNVAMNVIKKDPSKAGLLLGTIENSTSLMKEYIKQCEKQKIEVNMEIVKISKIAGLYNIEKQTIIESREKSKDMSSKEIEIQTLKSVVEKIKDIDIETYEQKAKSQNQSKNMRVAIAR